MNLKELKAALDEIQPRWEAISSQYNADAPERTDAEWDAIIAEYRKIEAERTELSLQYVAAQKAAKPAAASEETEANDRQKKAAANLLAKDRVSIDAKPAPHIIDILSREV